MVKNVVFYFGIPSFVPEIFGDVTNIANGCNESQNREYLRKYLNNIQTWQK